ncbi:hypothetical protein K6Y21_19175 [Motilimonas eburnea]|nr:hypothetical protein [Motilimonas eburnea]
MDHPNEAITSAYMPISQSELSPLVRYGKQKQTSYLVVKPAKTNNQLDEM